MTNGKRCCAPINIPDKLARTRLFDCRYSSRYRGCSINFITKIPLKGALIITTPEDVSVADTKNGIEMILKLEVPLLGLIENMSWFSPKESNKKYFLFGKDRGKDLSVDYKIDVISQLPLIETEGINVIYED